MASVIPPLVDIVIPVHGQPGFVLSLLQSLQHQPRMGDIILVDDASDKNVYEILQQQVEKIHDESGYHEVRLYKNDENKGFTLTVNRGMKKCNAPYVLILNSDTVAQPKAIEYMARNLDDGADVCGALLVFLPGTQYGGTVQHAGIGFTPDGIPYHPFMYLHPMHPAVQTWRRVNAVTGAAMMVKRDVWEKLGGFDKRYAPGAYEDVDYCTPRGIIYGDFEDISRRHITRAITHTGNEREILEHMSRAYSGDLIRIRPRGSVWIEVTPNHPILTLRGWIKANNILKTDYVFSPRMIGDAGKITIDMKPYCEGTILTDDGFKFSRTHKASHVMPFFIDVDKDVAWLLGMYIAEGYTDGNHVDFTLNQTEIEYANRIENILRCKFGVGHVARRKGKSAIHIMVTSKMLSRFLSANFGLGAPNKRMPEWLVHNTSAAPYVLRGIFDGDGHMGITPEFCTTSEVLAHQIKGLLSSLGIYAVVRENCKSVKSRHTPFGVYVMAQWRELFGKSTGLTIRKPRHATVNIIEDSNGWWVPISSIERTKFKGEVFNLRVDIDNSYALNGVTVHNCLMVKKAGGTIVYENKAMFGHFQHGSQTPANNFFTQPNLDKNLSYLITKHGRQPCDDEIFFKASGRG